MRTCQEFEGLYELYAMGVLDAGDRSEFEAHLRTGCPVCAAQVKQANALMSHLAAMPDQVQPPARLRRRVLASVGVEKSNWVWISAFAAAACTLIILTLWWNRDAQKRDAALADARAQIQRTASDLSSAHEALQLLNEPATKSDPSRYHPFPYVPYEKGQVT